jgi:hypothetical protein
MAWLEAKLAAMYLLINIFTHERDHRAINIPEPILPPFILPDESAQPLEKLVADLASRFYALASKHEAQEKEPKNG